MTLLYPPPVGVTASVSMTGKRELLDLHTHAQVHPFPASDDEDDGAQGNFRFVVLTYAAGLKVLQLHMNGRPALSMTSLLFVHHWWGESEKSR
ncbi:hypothetical protein [Pseudomonas chlororaphis]|uniref:hypothetical protein n=1 Tax=Pseudomonas chlororaphis TaxID=587753 RepID=UPI0039E38BB2